MAQKAEFESEKLDMDTLETVVAGAGAGIVADTKKKDVFSGLADLIAGSQANLGEAAATIQKAATITANQNAMNEAGSLITAGIAKINTGNHQEGNKALTSVVNEATAKLKSAFGLDNDTANAMAWSSAYKAVYETASTTAGRAAGVVDALKTSIVSHTADVARGLAAEVGFTGNLTGAMARTSDMMAQALKGASATAADEIRSKGAAAFETGLDAVKNTGIGKSVLAAFNDVKNVDAWKEAIANGAYSVISPSWATPIKFLAGAMADQATAKMIGLSDFASEVKQTAKAVVNAFDGIEKAFVDVYKSGFVAGMTMGLDVKGIINIGQNCADLGKAMVKGDTTAMANAAKELVTDMMYDMRDGLKAYYVDAPSKAFNWTKDITVGIMDDLGATPYVNMAAKVVADTFTDVGKAAANGSIHAMNVLEDFAKNEVGGALKVIGDMAKTSSNAVNALEDIARTGVKGAVGFLADALKTGNMVGRAEEALTRLITSNVPGALTEVSRVAGSVENAAWTIRNAAAAGSTAALNEIANLAKTTGGNIQRVCVDAVQVAIVKGVPGAIEKMADLVGSKVTWAADSAQHLFKQGGAAGQALLDGVEKLYGQAAGATAAVEWAAKYAANDVAKSAISELEKVAKSGSGYANQAIDSLSSVARSGGAYVNSAIDALKGLSGTVDTAKKALESVAKDVGGYAETAWKDLSKAAENTFNPSKW